MKLLAKWQEESMVTACIAKDILDAWTLRITGQTKKMMQIMLEFLHGGHLSSLTQSQIKTFIIDLLHRTNLYFPKRNDDRHTAIQKRKQQKKLQLWMQERRRDGARQFHATKATRMRSLQKLLSSVLWPKNWSHLSLEVIRVSYWNS